VHRGAEGTIQDLIPFTGAGRAFTEIVGSGNRPGP